MVDDIISAAFDDDGQKYGPVWTHSGWIGLRQMARVIAGRPHKTTGPALSDLGVRQRLGEVLAPVRHADQAKLRRVYGELVNKAGEDPDLPVVSETSDNFISKLRIAVTPISATPSESVTFE